MEHLEDFMTREVETLKVDQSLMDALRFLREHSVRHIPILDDAGALVGILTDRDIKRATPSALAPGQRDVWEKVVAETTLAKVMTKDPMTATPKTTLREALKTFVEDRIGCLPIMDGGKLVGIVTARDLFRASLAALG